MVQYNLPPILGILLPPAVGCPNAHRACCPDRARAVTADTPWGTVGSGVEPRVLVGPMAGNAGYLPRKNFNRELLVRPALGRVQYEECLSWIGPIERNAALQWTCLCLTGDDDGETNPTASLLPIPPKIVLTHLPGFPCLLDLIVQTPAYV